MWKEEDAYIVGGGPSLKAFDWDLIKGRNVIGCNGAYALGSHICKIVIFGDFLWWEKIARRNAIERYGGIVVGCSSRMKHPPEPWVRLIRRGGNGLCVDALAWNGNTGSLAINLALILGVQKVFLLGFDMKLGRCKEGHLRANYHELRYESPKAHVYPRFARGFQKLADALPGVFPGREIWNITDDSELDMFPKIGLVEHFGAKVS